MEKISVIIPMYNAEPYIQRCIQSLWDQTYQNWEAIVIDDGSTDQGPAICRRLAAGDRRIRVITKEHGGVSAARNCGLDAARGIFLFFLDSDDAIHPLLLEEMLLQARKTNADLLACDQAKLEAAKLEPALRTASVYDPRPDWKTPPRTESPALSLSQERLISGAGGKMVRHSAARGLRFREDLFLGEDTYYIHQLLHRLVRVAYTSKQWYYYMRHPESLTRSQKMVTDPSYYAVYHLLQEDDLADGYERDAAVWERVLLKSLLDRYLLRRRAKDAAGIAALREIAAAEFRRPLFLSLRPKERWYYQWAFFNYPRFRAACVCTGILRYWSRLFRRLLR